MIIFDKIEMNRIENNEIQLSVWERDSGLTLACGSAACACFAASIRMKFVKEKKIDLNYIFPTLHFLHYVSEK